MKVLVNGAQGQLGQDVVRQLQGEHNVIGFARREWDVTNEEFTRNMIETEQPNIVIHCAAYTNVDDAEADPMTAFRVNTDGARNVATICGERNVTMVYLSTDYVFDGAMETGYDEWDRPNPLNIYGRSKEAGERAVRSGCPRHFILRTSWLFGPHGSNFLTAIAEKARTSTEVAVVDDQTGSPTYTGHLAEKIGELIGTAYYGTYHTAGHGACTWFELARAFVAQAGFQTKIVPVSSQEMVRQAKRPVYSILRSLSLPAKGITLLPHWKEGVSQFIHRWNGGVNHD